ncbi:MAG: hypothetical protein WDA24_01345 [Tissierellales bacterium]
MHLVYKSFGDYYYVTKTGKLVKPHPNFIGRSYSDGLTPIYDKNKGLGYVDTSGKVVIPMSLPAITTEDGEVIYSGYFVDGHALVYKGTGYEGSPYEQELWYTIDKTGKKVDIELSTDTLVVLDLGYPHNSVWETVNINGANINVFFNEGLALAGTNQGAEFWVIEKLNQAAPKPELPKEEPAQPYTNLSSLSLTSWQSWDSGTTLNYRITNSTDKVDRGAYAVLICGSGYDSTKVRGTEDYITSRFANSDYYPIEGHIFEYQAQPKETIRNYIWSQIGREVDVAEEDLGKGDLKYIVIKLKSEEEKSQLQAEFNSLGLGLYDWFSREENNELQNWLRQKFGLTKGENSYEKFN